MSEPVFLIRDKSRVLDISRGAPVLIPYAANIGKKLHGDASYLGEPIRYSSQENMNVFFFYVEELNEVVVVVLFFGEVSFYKLGVVQDFMTNNVLTTFSEPPMWAISFILDSFNNGFVDDYTKLTVFYNHIIAGWCFVDPAERGVCVMLMRNNFIRILASITQTHNFPIDRSTYLN